MYTVLNLVSHPGFIPSVSKFAWHQLVNEGVASEDSSWEDVALYLMRNSALSDNPFLIPQPMAEVMTPEIRQEFFHRIIMPAMAAVPPTEGMSIEGHLEKFLSELLSLFREVDGADMLLEHLTIPEGMDFDTLLDEFAAH